MSAPESLKWAQLQGRELTDQEMFFLLETMRHAKGMQLGDSPDFFEGLAGLMKPGRARDRVETIANFCRETDRAMNGLLVGLIQPAEGEEPKERKVAK